MRLGGGGGGESHRWGTFTIWYFIRGGGGVGNEIHGGGGGVPCDTGFNSPTEKVAENIVTFMGNTRLGPHYFKSLDVFYINISKH